MMKSENSVPGLDVRRVAAWAVARRAPNQRRGQAVWSFFAVTFPNEVEPLRGGPLDPFYNDDLIEAFVVEVERRALAAQGTGGEKSDG